MFKKVGYSSNINAISKEDVLADPVLVERMTKLAHQVKTIAPKSDDFLYFSIIFLKAAESALLDEKGDIKKVGSEKAWGYFDENWKWHGNVKPHRNNNMDIFPESELRKAAQKWIGMPLCKDHESSSVDGIRGIILDAHYDETRKQVVGLCALDRVNYPDLARKVETGIVRYGSMGTAVETSVCSECCNKARTQQEYCDHVSKKAAWGEINVGLKPIEYSLVVQPAEPGAVLLRCIASLQEYRKEFINYGVEDFDNLLGSLSVKQAEHLSTIVKTACGDAGCSPSERKRIIVSFLKNNDLLKIASSDEKSSGLFAPRLNSEEQLNLTSDEDTYDSNRWVRRGGGDVNVYDGASGPLVAAPSTDDGDVILDKDTPSNNLRYASEKSNNSEKASKQKSLISLIMEDIMNESKLKKRAELRRKLAYHQGGSEGVEPKGYKSKPFSFNEDKHMQQTKSMGSKESLFPGDDKVKEKLSRASLEERHMKRLAYLQGGNEKGAEPAGYKSKPFSFNEDKHMHQSKSMGSVDGLFPGDDKVKEKLKRAAYNGPALKTKLSWPVLANGLINKKASVFEVYAGDKKVIAATGHEIFGDEVSENWDWFTSKEYGQEVCKQIRASGLNHVASLLKGAQAATPTTPVAPPSPMTPPAPPAGPSMDIGSALGGEEEEEDTGSEEEKEESGSDKKDAKAEIEKLLTEVEAKIAETKELLNSLGDEGVKINIDVDEEKGAKVKSGEEPTLASSVFSQVKTAMIEMDEVADELAMIAETYEGINRLSAANRADLRKIARETVSDAIRLIGETTALNKVASKLSRSIVKVANTDYSEEAYDMMHDQGKHHMGHMHNSAADSIDHSDIYDMTDDLDEDDTMDYGMDHSMDEGDDAMDYGMDEEANDLVSKAMDLRRSRREQLIVEAARKSTKMKKEDKKEEKSSKKEMKKEKASKEEEEESKDKKMSKAASIKDMVSEAFNNKKAEEERDGYKIKLRRAYDVAIEMQKKGLIGLSKTALDKQVDDIMDFDDRAFEAFKRSIANAKPVQNVKVATDLGGVNVGIESSEPAPTKASSKLLSMLWD